MMMNQIRSYSLEIAVLSSFLKIHKFDNERIKPKKRIDDSHYGDIIKDFITIIFRNNFTELGKNLHMNT